MYVNLKTLEKLFYRITVVKNRSKSISFFHDKSSSGNSKLLTY